MKKSIFFKLAAAIFFCSLGFSMESMKIENSSYSLHCTTLDNGLNLFVIPDRNSALVSIRFVSRAGFSSQSPSTCGFFSLYSNLFYSLAGSDAMENFETWNLRSECKADCTLYSLEIPPEDFESFLTNLDSCLVCPDFSDRKIKAIQNKMKEDSISYAESTSGFINSAIDGKIFNAEPWKHDSGIYPALFREYTPAQAKTILGNISRNYYIPQNCALFVSGNIDADKVIETTGNILKNWQTSQVPFMKKNIPLVKNTSDVSRKFILSSPEFSKELSQAVIQFTDLDFYQSTMLALLLDDENGQLKNSLMKNELTAIRSKEYVAAQCAEKNGDGRLVIQALMEEPYFFSSDRNIRPKKTVFDQADSLIDAIKKSCIVSDENITEAKKYFEEKFTAVCGNSTNLLNLLADYWSVAEWITLQDFYDGFKEKYKTLGNTETDSIFDCIAKGTPYVFLLLNDKVLESHKNLLEQNGYQIIDRNNSSWWKNEAMAKIARTEKNEILREEKKSASKIIGARPSEFFYANSLKTLKEGKISNGIPVIVKENKGSQTVSVNITIDGGILASPEKEKNLRTIMVAALAKNSKIEGIKNETLENSSCIYFETTKENFEKSIRLFADALVYGEISPVAADRLFAEENYRYMMENANLGKQMKNNVLAYLYRNTKIGNIYRDYSNRNNWASYQSLLTAYTDLLDASLYSIVICGDINLKDAADVCENYLGVLRNQKERTREELPQLQWKNKERNIQLVHLYTSDLPPELAPKESPLLVPTKDFSDPVQLYFTGPSDNLDQVIYNALLKELAWRIGKETQLDCFVHNASSIFYAGILQANKVKKASVFIKSFEKQRKILADELKNRNEKTLRRIKTRHEIDILGKASTNEGTAALLTEGLKKGKCSAYLDEYLAMENADEKKFIEILEAWIEAEPKMKVYSVDGKK